MALILMVEDNFYSSQGVGYPPTCGVISCITYSSRSLRSGCDFNILLFGFGAQTSVDNSFDSDSLIWCTGVLYLRLFCYGTEELS